jgi:hypothetical protein
LTLLVEVCSQWVVYLLLLLPWPRGLELVSLWRVTRCCCTDCGSLAVAAALSAWDGVKLAVELPSLLLQLRLFAHSRFCLTLEGLSLSKLWLTADRLPAGNRLCVVGALITSVLLCCCRGWAVAKAAILRRVVA